MGVSLVFIALFVIFKEIEQHGHDSKFPKDWGSWWNNKTAWKNKHNWKPSWLFKTALVWTTDAEHFFQMLSNISVSIALGFATQSIYFSFASLGVVWLFSYIMNEKVLDLDELNDE